MQEQREQNFFQGVTVIEPIITCSPKLICFENNIIGQSQTEKIKKERKKQLIVRSLRKERSEISKEQIMCIALMNEYCPIRMSLPMKEAKFSEQYMRIKSFEVDGEWFDLSCFLKQRCHDIYELDVKEGVLEKTASRRKQKNKKITEVQMYQDYLSFKNYFFVCYNQNETESTKKLQPVRKIFKNEKIFMDRARIEKCVHEIYLYLISLLKSSKGGTVEIQKDTLKIKQIVEKYCF